MHVERSRVHLKVGDSVLWERVDGEARLTTRRERLRRALVLRLTQHRPEGRILDTDELANITHKLGWLNFHRPSRIKNHT